MRISQRELRNDNAEIMRRVEQGETFTVTRNGHPVGQLGPLQTAGADPFVPIDSLLAAARGLPPVDLARFRRDVDRHGGQQSRPVVNGDVVGLPVATVNAKDFEALGVDLIALA